MPPEKIIKLLRTQRGISQKDFAKMAGITSNYLSSIEGGKKKPSLEFLKNAADILGIPVAIFLWEKVDMSKIKDADTREIAKKVEQNLIEIKEMLFKKLIEQ